MGEISSEIYGQARLLLESLALGLWLMACYDLIRISRILISRWPWLGGLEDFFYWIYVSLSVFALLYRLNDGVLRGWAVGCVFLGMIFYDRIVSRNLMKALKKAVDGIKINYYNRRQKRKKIRSKTDIKSGDADEGQEEAVPDAQTGQVGKPDGIDRNHSGGAEPGCGGESERRVFKGQGSGIPDQGRESYGSEDRRRAEDEGA